MGSMADFYFGDTGLLRYSADQPRDEHGRFDSGESQAEVDKHGKGGSSEVVHEAQGPASSAALASAKAGSVIVLTHAHDGALHSFRVSSVAADGIRGVDGKGGQHTVVAGPQGATYISGPRGDKQIAAAGHLAVLKGWAR